MNDRPLVTVGRRLLARDVPWSVVALVALVCYASVGIAAGIWGFDWTVVIGEVPWHQRGGPSAPEIAVFRPVRTLGPLAFGVLAAALWTRRPRLAWPLGAVAALLTVNVLVQQYAMYVPRDGAGRHDYVLGLGLYLAGTVGLVAATFFAARRQRRRVGVALWATGVTTMAVVGWYVLRTYGPDGVWQGFLLVQVGPAATLWSGALLVVAGGVLVQRPAVRRTSGGTSASTSTWDSSGASSSSSTSGTSISRGSSVSRRAPLGAILLTGAATAGLLLGTRLPWVTTAFPPDATVGIRQQVVDPAPGDATIVLLVAASLVALALSTRARWRRLAGTLAFACGAVVTTVPFLTQFNERLASPAAPGLYLAATVGVALFAAALLFGGNRQAFRTDGRSGDVTPRTRWRIQPGAALVALAGVGLVLAGVLLEWTVALPGTGGDAGTAVALVGVGADAILLGFAAAGLLGALTLSVRSRPATGGLLLFATGIAAAVVALAALVAATGTGSVAANGLVVAPGAPVTLLGSALLAIAGAVQYTGTTASANPVSEGADGARSDGSGEETTV